jgi:hypothetical protein
MRKRLDIWDDDESDELFYVDRYVLMMTSLFWCPDKLEGLAGAI